jgi:hypothetical protein
VGLAVERQTGGREEKEFTLGHHLLVAQGKDTMEVTGVVLLRLGVAQVAAVLAAQEPTVNLVRLLVGQEV